MAYLDEKSFKKHISTKKFNNIYIIFGDEKYLVRFYTGELTKAVAGSEPSDFAFHKFTQGVELQTLADAVGIVPFMAEYNCVVVEDLDVNAFTKDQYDSFKGILSSVPDSTVLIFSMSSVAPKKEKPEKSKSTADEVGEEEGKTRNRFKLFCNFVDKMGMGCVAELNMRSATALEHQLAKWADKIGKKLSLPVASKIIYYCGTDLATLRLELDKVCAYAGDSDEITLDMVEATVTKKLEAKVYDMVDNVIYGNTDKAYTQLSMLFALKEDPRDILRILGFAYIDLYRARVTVESGSLIKDTADFFKYGNRKWVLDKAQTKSRQLSTNALRDSLGAIADLTAKMNSVSMNEEAAIHKLIADLVLIAVRERENA